MKIKGLLLGSAAALAMGGAAQAADLPVAAVSACPAGTLDLNGSCLDISGFTRLNLTASSVAPATHDRRVDWASDARLVFTATTETDMGTLSGSMRLNIGNIAGASGDNATFSGSDAVTMDRATVQLGGFLAGYTGTVASAYQTGDALMGLTGDNSNAANQLSYSGSAGAISYAVGIEENRVVNATTTTSVSVADLVTGVVTTTTTTTESPLDANNTPALAASMSYDGGMFSVGAGAHFVSYTDAGGSQTGYAFGVGASVSPTDMITAQMNAAFGNNNGAIIGNVGKDGTTSDAGENWYIGGSVKFAATDAISLGIGAAYDDDRDIEAGVNATWAPVSGFSVAAEAMFFGHGENPGVNSDNGNERIDFLLRINRSF